MRYFLRKKIALSIAISNLIIVALAILFWQYDIFNRLSTQSPSDETKALLMDDPKVVADAREAISLAEDLGMPTGNPIYFCIDTDVTKSQMTTYIVPYVQGILSELEGSGYKLGIYGPKPVCKYIRGTYSATERYMMICDNDWGQSGWSATERDFDDWNIRQYEWNQSLPGVSSVTIDKCESSTNGGGGWKL